MIRQCFYLVSRKNVNSGIFLDNDNFHEFRWQRENFWLTAVDRNFPSPPHSSYKQTSIVKINKEGTKSCPLEKKQQCQFEIDCIDPLNPLCM